MFDDYLRARAAEDHADFVPFDPVADYKEFVDGKPRDEGLRSFLASASNRAARRLPEQPSR